jgi:glycosyltransferase involved in cell wall biosynthesis
LARASAQRIALLTTSYPRHAGDPSGHFVRSEARQLAAAGHEVFVFCPGVSLARDDGVEVVGCRGGDAFGWPGALERMAQRPAAVFDAAAFAADAGMRVTRKRFDRVVAHFIVPCGALALGARGELEVVGHGTDVRLLARLPGRALLVAALLARRARFRFASRRMRDRLLVALPAPLCRRLEAASTVVAPAIEVVRPDRDAIRRRRAELSRGSPIVAMCGRLIEGKGFQHGIRSIAAAGATALVIGDGPMRRRLMALAPDALFVGLRQRTDALLDIAASDLLLHPSRDEGAPTVVREARALGVPVLCLDAGDTADWASQDAGITLTTRDRQGDALAQLLARR